MNPYAHKGYVERDGQLVKVKPGEAGLPPADEHGGESDLHNAIISHCKSRRWIYLHGSMAHRAMRTSGEPDFVLLADYGRVFFIECKTAKGKLTPEQAGLAMAASILGHKIHIVRSFEQFLEITNLC